MNINQVASSVVVYLNSNSVAPSQGEVSLVSATGCIQGKKHCIYI